jgi:hypothetical protein
MNSREYIRIGLQRLVNRYPKLTFIYQFDEVENMHVVQVDPQDEFESNDAYQEDEANLTFDFDNTFFPESVVFISQESLISIKSPEYIIYTPHVIDDVLLSFNFKGIKDKEYLAGENNYALAA